MSDHALDASITFSIANLFTEERFSPSESKELNTFPRAVVACVTITELLPGFISATPLIIAPKIAFFEES